MIGGEATTSELSWHPELAIKIGNNTRHSTIQREFNTPEQIQRKKMPICQYNDRQWPIWRYPLLQGQTSLDRTTAMTRTAYASLLSRSLHTYHTACLVCHLYSSVYCLWTMKTKDRVLCTSTPSLIPVAHILYQPPPCFLLVVVACCRCSGLSTGDNCSVGDESDLLWTQWWQSWWW